MAYVLLRLRLPVGPGAPGTARRCVQALAPYLGEDLAEELALLVSELVTNSVRHGELSDEACIDVGVESNDALRVEVIDPGIGFARAARPTDDASGWGLVIVDELADRWGVSEDHPTRVWLEIDPRRRCTA